jgi:hypothetical protein
LTNTRYVIGSPELVDLLNDGFDPVQRRFHAAARFNIGLKSGLQRGTGLQDMTAALAPDGNFALIEFAGALPRASLYSNWQVNTNGQAVLDELTSADFDPARTVLVSGGLPDHAAPSGANANAGTVEIESYASRRVMLQANATLPSVLLLNDRFDPNWKVLVDGAPQKILRCNYLMRGVYLQPGVHRVEFGFAPPVGPLYVSVAGVATAVLLLGVVLVVERRKAPRLEATIPIPIPSLRAAAPVARNGSANGHVPAAPKAKGKKGRGSQQGLQKG